MNSYHAWISGPKGRLAPAEQAKLWALRKVLQKEGGASDQYQWMASQVSLLGGGHPTRQAVAQFFARVDADKKWNPGKREPGQGRPQQLTKKKRSIIARSAMSLKRRCEHSGQGLREDADFSVSVHLRSTDARRASSDQNVFATHPTFCLLHTHSTFVGALDIFHVGILFAAYAFHILWCIGYLSCWQAFT